MSLAESFKARVTNQPNMKLVALATIELGALGIDRGVHRRYATNGSWFSHFSTGLERPA